jgi:hypothetical protein
MGEINDFEFHFQNITEDSPPSSKYFQIGEIGENGSELACCPSSTHFYGQVNQEGFSELGPEENSNGRGDGRREVEDQVAAGH